LLFFGGNTFGQSVLAQGQQASAWLTAGNWSSGGILQHQQIAQFTPKYCKQLLVLT
jgi:hypothetical protein